LVTIQVDLYDRLALNLEGDLVQMVSKTQARGVLIDISAVTIVDSFMGRIIGNIASMSRILDAETVMWPMVWAMAKRPTPPIRFLHDRIRKTRGIVGMVVFYSRVTRQWKIAGVGDIALRWIAANNSRNYVSYNGIIGYNIPGSMNDQVVSLDEYNQFIACSYGIRSRWDLTKFRGIGHRDGMIIASAIYKEFARGNDDASVIVCKSV